MRQKTRAKRVCVPSRLILFFSRDTREKEREMPYMYTVAATATRRNSKTTIIKANSKEVVRKKKTGRLRLIKDARFVLKTFIFLIYLYIFFFYASLLVKFLQRISLMNFIHTNNFHSANMCGIHL